MAILDGKKERVDRLPAFNSVCTHTVDGMKAFDAYWPAAHRNPTKMAKLGSALHRLADLESVAVPFDLTLEAEVFGAPIEFFEDRIKWPSIKKFIARSIYDLKFPKDLSETGRIPVITEAIKILKRELEGVVPVNVYMVPPFTSISSYLVDSKEFLKWLVRSPEKAKEFMKSTVNLYSEIACIYEDAGADVITLHEMGASSDNISPRQFDTFVKPYLKKMIGRLKIPTILNICGSTLLIVDKMIECGASAIAIEERTPVKKAREMADSVKPGYPILGNVPSYGVIHVGPVKRIREAVKMSIKDGIDIVAPGCDFWLETPTEHIKAFVDAAHQQKK